MLFVFDENDVSHSGGGDARDSAELDVIVTDHARADGFCKFFDPLIHCRCFICLRVEKKAPHN